jgi:hypothetical protein
LTKALKKMKKDKDLSGSTLVTPRELSEDKAVKNWCQNINVNCTGEDTSNDKTRGSKQAEDLLGESFSSHLPSPPFVVINGTRASASYILQRRRRE